MHYCHSCDTQIAMEPHDGFAICPICGRMDDGAAVRPLFVVTGASGSGKTAGLAPLAHLLTGRCVTFDVDWLIDAARDLGKGPPVRWPAFQEAWLAIAHGVAQAGMPTVLLGLFIPRHLEELSARRWVGATATFHCLIVRMTFGGTESRLAPPGVGTTLKDRSDSESGSAPISTTISTRMREPLRTSPWPSRSGLSIE